MVDGLENPVWVDTVGWDDADLDDDHTFKEILNFIGQNHLLKVKVSRSSVQKKEESILK